MKLPMLLFAKGLAIGAANVIPGISGGTIALILGVYMTALEALGQVFTPRLEKRAAVTLLVPLALGIMLGILASALIMRFLLVAYASWISVAITGLVMGSIPFLLKKAKKHPPNLLAILLLTGGFLFSVALALFAPKAQWTVATQRTELVLFFAAIPAMTAMIIPGISGSLVLVMLGVYPLFLSSIASLQWLSLSAFFLGGGISLVLFARGFRRLYQRHPRYVLWPVLGLVLGSPAALLSQAPISEKLILHIGLLLLSLVASLLLFSIKNPNE